MKPHLFCIAGWWFARAGAKTYLGSYSAKTAYQRYYLDEFGLLGP